MLGELGLDQHLAGLRAAPGAAGDLHDGLRQALRRAEVGAEQALVGIQHHHQRHVREVVALGDHLRADQDARIAEAMRCMTLLEVAAPAHDVAIEARDAPPRETACRASPRCARCPGRPAFTAKPHCGQRCGSGCVGAAVMAAQPAARPMHRQARVALAARRHPAAGGAQQRRRIAAAVQEHQHLAAAARCRSMASTAGVEMPPRTALCAQVDAAPAAAAAPGRGAPLQPQQLVAAGRDVVQRLERRRRRAEQHRDARRGAPAPPPDRAPSSGSPLRAA